MIAAQTSAAWIDIEIEVDDGGGAAQWNPEATVADAYAAANSFRDWIDVTFSDASSWVWSRDSSNGAAVITFTLPIGYSIAPSSEAIAILGAVAAGAGATSSAWTSPSGTIAPMTVTASAIVDQRIKVLSAQGLASAAGVTRVGVGGLASYRTRVRWPASSVDTERLRAVQAVMVSPRVASIYGGAAYGWLPGLSIGPITLSKSGTRLWRAVAEVRG
jgi:hypothetical protein